MRRRGVSILIFCFYSIGMVHAEPHCTRPISYRLNRVDSEFGLSRNTIRTALSSAAKIWEFGTGRRRFYESEKGVLQVNLIYTPRQDAIQAIKILEAESKLVQESVEKFNAKQSSLNKQVENFNKISEAHGQEISKHNQAVAAFNRRRYSPTYAQQLKRDGLFLRQRSLELAQKMRELNDKLDAAARSRETVDQEVVEFNADKVELDTILARMPDYERLGEYREANGETTINLYVIRNKAQLTLLLAHELGHALGLEHVVDPSALMYPRETTDNTRLRFLHREDLKAFRSICGKTGQNPTGNYF